MGCVCIGTICLCVVGNVLYLIPVKVYEIAVITKRLAVNARKRMYECLKRKNKLHDKRTVNETVVASSVIQLEEVSDSRSQRRFDEYVKRRKMLDPHDQFEDIPSLRHQDSSSFGYFRSQNRYSEEGTFSLTL